MLRAVAVLLGRRRRRRLSTANDRRVVDVQHLDVDVGDSDSERGGEDGRDIRHFDAQCVERLHSEVDTAAVPEWRKEGGINLY